LRIGGRTLRISLLAAIALFMFAPSAIMAVESFSNESYLKFPPHSFGLRQYAHALSGPRWVPALERSLVVAFSAAGIALVVGALAALALHRARLPGRRTLEALAVAPLLVPALAYAIALYVVFVRLHLLGTRAGLIAAHAVLGLPFVVLLVGGALGNVPRELEGAAMSLGAERARALLDVTARLLLPVLAAAFTLAFLTSFDEVVVAAFVSGVGYETLPRAILADVRDAYDPAVNAIGTVLTVVTAVLLAFVGLLRRRSL
jgi:mannopine transport system permease protein